MLGPPRYFPPAECADEEGVLLVGGSLSPSWLLDAYAHGIFPWPFVDGFEVLVWFSPDPRAILPLDRFHVSRSLRRTLRQEKFTVTLNHDFRGVIDGCATGPGREGGTWITPSMIAAYVKLHELGYAQSVEVWCGEELVGGTYGVVLGGLFAAESMFSRQPDASKVALTALVERMTKGGFSLLDIQQLTPHTARLGAIEIRRSEYLRRLEQALRQEARL